jgi:hypothetical protein
MGRASLSLMAVIVLALVAALSLNAFEQVVPGGRWEGPCQEAHDAATYRLHEMSALIVQTLRTWLRCLVDRSYSRLTSRAGLSSRSAVNLVCRR